MRSRVINGILAFVFLVLTLAGPVRGLVWPHDAAAEVRAGGGVVFNDEAVNEGARSAQYIMLFLFGSLTLVFGWRAIRGSGARGG